MISMGSGADDGVRRTGHWVARSRGVYLRRRSSQPFLVWDARAEASSFRTRLEVEAEVRRSGFRGPMRDVVIERVAQTWEGFGRWRRDAS